jgi:hypothetical protein
LRRLAARALLAPGSPRDLAVLRISVFAVALLDVDVHRAPSFAALPASLRSAPAGLAWLAPYLGVRAAWAAYAVFLASSALGLVGLRTRAAALAALGSGFYLLGLPQFYGSVLHDHHLIWFIALLAASPSGDALSVDAWRKGEATPSPAHGVPLRMAWLLVGILYFFPGYWKWRTGLAWATGDNLVNQMHAKWMQMGGFRPFFRIDRHPYLCHAAALAVMGFEVSFVFLVGLRRVRPFAAVAAIAFHLATDLFMGIRFTSLWLCYGMFFDWSRRGQGAPAATAWRGALPALAVGAVLVAGNTWCGVRCVTSGWPFACYPTFHALAGPEMPSLEVEVVEASGRVTRPDDRALAGRLGPTKSWGLRWSLALAPPGGARHAALADYARLFATAGAAEVRLWRVWLPVDPDAPPRPARREMLDVIR